jgi:hypothetical protein
MISLYSPSISEYVSRGISEHLYEPAFLSIVGKLEMYIDICNTKKNSVNNLSLVLNAPMGHGKTTALTTVMKMMGDNRNYHKEITPLLLVFNNGDAMKAVFNHVEEFAKEKYIPHLITFIDDERASIDNLVNLNQYQFVCITQQRLRDLSVKSDKWSYYLNYKGKKNQKTFSVKKFQHVTRHIIVDEKPIFFNEAIFDVGNKNNCVHWFDELSNISKLEQQDKDFARKTIAMLLASEVSRGARGRTSNLRKQLNASEEYRLLKILNVIQHQQTSPELNRKLDWFLRLLQNDAVGHIDGKSIICSEWIDYTKLGNLLILDGTSSVTNALYSYGGYKIIDIPNYHSYSKRLFLHHRDINTTSQSRQKSDRGVQIAITNDLQIIRAKGNNPIPLCSKSDVEVYLKSGAITDEQKSHFIVGTSTDEETGLALNLLNVTGRNELSSYDSLALLNLPIRPPQFYRVMAIGMYGVNIDTRTSKEAGEKTGRWFFDGKVEELFRQSILADMSQIIHRTDLRNLKSSKEINIYFYHNQKIWNEMLQKLFNLPKNNVKSTKVKNKKLHGFDEKCIIWAEKARHACMEAFDGFNEPTITPSQIGNNFKKWLSEHWSNESKQEIIKEEFSKQGLLIEENSANKRKKIILVD